MIYSNNFLSINSNRLFALIVFVFTLAHLYNINSPPNGYHQWRESDTAAVALNYYQEDFSFLNPRINQRGAGSGITGMELPIYSFLSGALYFVFGPHHFIPRLITLAMGLLGLFWFYRAVSLLSGSRIALWSSWALAFSPLYYFYAYKIMPDITMVSLLLGAAYYFISYTQRLRLRELIISGILLSISACLKPLGLLFYLPALILLVSKVAPKAQSLPRVVISYVLYVAITFSVMIAWFQFARLVNIEQNSAGFYLGENFWEFPTWWFRAIHFKKVFLQWPPELWIGWALLPAFIYGVFALRKLANSLFFVSWLVGGYIILGLTAQLSTNHDYYSLVILPPIALITGAGIEKLLALGSWRKWTALALVALAPVAAGIRVSHRFGATPEFESVRAASSQSIPTHALVMVEDNTTAVRLYQLNRRGWPIRFGVTYEKLTPCIEAGARYLILENPIETYPDSLENIVVGSTFRVGPFFGYEIQGEEKL